ncbi:small ribosomal subunit protein mS22 [Tribolium castaneum]|uniref:28S ribosomal protein S22, mitochondrial-like Protein n=1 Tax=Tribolium castaneum TaxID=7070 RepID=D6WJ69_TRICA|nr:PREDICTED: 28S ribosomal protein S22, mitochondrial [Tribolium castaneum]EFA04432.1 28S ribosomal protein S22, mitochondrial-like Protein [Tribolium castaneum]|eukprot:XP_975160.1 PREDICTED: 28S ribosomal protein S22, mitochondrial [Tribolium castaneum]
MAAFRYFSKKLLSSTLKTDIRAPVSNNYVVCVRLLSYTPMPYDGNPDPGPIFIKKEVQTLLTTLTRVDLAKVYRKRKLGGRQLEQPVYKFMTDEQLQEALDEAKRKVDEILQIPPVVAVRKPRDKVVSRDPALQGLDSSNYIFTDISYGVPDSERIILVRDTEGTLRDADWATRDRINQMYFPVARRQVTPPKMFEDDKLDDLLKRGEYNFILDRACLQFEPNDEFYQKVCSVTYQHINENNKFEDIRSTRHFGSFAFFIAWHKMIDNLLLDLIESEHIDEANALVELYAQLHGEKFRGNSIEEYIGKFSTKKAALELALQAYKNAAKQKHALEEGIKRAHGLN